MINKNQYSGTYKNSFKEQDNTIYAEVSYLHQTWSFKELLRRPGPRNIRRSQWQYSTVYFVSYLFKQHKNIHFRYWSWQVHSFTVRYSAKQMEHGYTLNICLLLYKPLDTWIRYPSVSGYTLWSDFCWCYSKKNSTKYSSKKAAIQISFHYFPYKTNTKIDLFKMFFSCYSWIDWLVRNFP